MSEVVTDFSPAVYPLELKGALGQGRENKATVWEDPKGQEWIFLQPRVHRDDWMRHQVPLSRDLGRSLQNQGIVAKIPVFEYAPRDEKGNFMAVGYRKIQGDCLTVSYLHEAPYEKTDCLLRDLAECLGAFHRFPRNSASAAYLENWDTKTDMANTVDYFEKVSEGRMDDDLRLDILSQMNLFLSDEGNFQVPNALVHGDICINYNPSGSKCGNIVHDPETGALRGLIDLGSVRFGAPETDLIFPYLHLGDEKFKQSMLPYLGVKDPSLFMKRLSAMRCESSMYIFCSALQNKNIRCVRGALADLALWAESGGWEKAMEL